MPNGLLALRWQNFLSIWIMIGVLAFIYVAGGQIYRQVNASNSGG